VIILKIIGLILAGLLLVGSSATAYAAPFNAVDKNPNIVAAYDDGLHAIIGLKDSPGLFHVEGKDVVMAAGKSGNFQQWYENGIGYHSVWLHVGDSMECPNSFVLVVEAKNPPGGDTWGDYLEDGNYCVKTNAYKKGN
jgi:hypothetical protein